jgi:hypothetical protein
MPDDPEPKTTTLHALHFPSIIGQDWHDTIGLIQQHIQEQRLIALEVTNKAISDQLDEVEGRCHALWNVDAERRWRASTSTPAEA